MKASFILLNYNLTSKVFDVFHQVFICCDGDHLDRTFSDSPFVIIIDAFNMEEFMLIDDEVSYFDTRRRLAIEIVFPRFSVSALVLVEFVSLRLKRTVNREFFKFALLILIFVQCSFNDMIPIIIEAEQWHDVVKESWVD